MGKLNCLFHFLVYNSVVCILIISLDSIKFVPHDQAVEEDQDLKRRNKKYHANCTNNIRSSA